MDQPVPAEKLRELYTQKLEVQVSKSELDVHARNVQAQLAAFQARVEELEKEFSVDFKDYDVDLKAGTMKLLPSLAGNRGVTPRAVRRRGLRKATS